MKKRGGDGRGRRNAWRISFGPSVRVVRGASPCFVLAFSCSDLAACAGRARYSGAIAAAADRCQIRHAPVSGMYPYGTYGTYGADVTSVAGSAVMAKLLGRDATAGKRLFEMTGLAGQDRHSCRHARVHSSLGRTRECGGGDTSKNVAKLSPIWCHAKSTTSKYGNPHWAYGYIRNLVVGGAWDNTRRMYGTFRRQTVPLNLAPLRRPADGNRPSVEQLRDGLQSGPRGEFAPAGRAEQADQRSAGVRRAGLQAPSTEPRMRRPNTLVSSPLRLRCTAPMTSLAESFRSAGGRA